MRLFNDSILNDGEPFPAAMVEQGYRDVEDKVTRMMSEKNLKIEFFDPEE